MCKTPSDRGDLWDFQFLGGKTPSLWGEGYHEVVARLFIKKIYTYIYNNILLINIDNKTTKVKSNK